MNRYGFFNIVLNLCSDEENGSLFAVTCSDFIERLDLSRRAHERGLKRFKRSYLQRSYVFAEIPETPPRPRSMAPASRNSLGGIGGGGSSTGTGASTAGWGESSIARALFAYLSSGENQLSFLEGDLIALMGECRLQSGE